MIPPIEKLYKFLKLEIERNFDNRAVFGGLHHYAQTWLTEAQTHNLSPDVTNEVFSKLTGYVNETAEQRPATIHSIIELLDLPVELKSIPPRLTSKPGAPDTSPFEDDSDIEPAIFNSPARDEISLPYKKRQVPNRNTEQIGSAYGIHAPITNIHQIGPKNAELYHKLGIQSILDLLYYFPRKYVDFSKLKPINRLEYGEIVTVMATVVNTFTRVAKGGKLNITECVVSDGSGSLRLTWFNQPWLENRLRPGTQITASGKLDMYLGRLMLSNPEWELLDQEHLHTNRIVPTYSLTAGLTSKAIRKVMNGTVSFWAPRIDDFLPTPIREGASLVDLTTALQQVHFPSNLEQLERSQRRLAFDEIFLLQLGVIRQKLNWQKESGRLFVCEDEFINPIVESLPYTLTAAQWKVLNEIRHDLYSGQAMNRLIQGDVGSGKTIVAALAAAIIVRTGAQAAYMAPTSILAEQQYRSLMKVLSEGENAVLQPDQIRLLISDLPADEKEALKQSLAAGEVKVVIGTHALLEDPVTFQDLQLVIIDEQHRFGVEQRATLRSKGTNPHLLVMTATPIPRSLALTLYGDLDVSIIDELPHGRLPIQTHIVHPLSRERAYQLVRDQVAAGHQAFIIYPLVEQGEQEETKAAVEEQARLQQEVFKTYQIGLLHGRMKPEEKDQVMKDMRDKNYQVLVSTSVVEVGVDIPNATVMIIEGANRFGLAQLHQFRGRVGRGQDQSYCLLIPEKEDDLENARLQVMIETNDGFELAEKDLQQRGPGDFLGTRQAGFAELQMASITDLALIEEARKYAYQVFEADPELEKPEHQALKSMVDHFWHVSQGDIS